MFGDGDSTQPGGVSPSLNRFRCPGNEPLGIPEPTRRILARPYVRSAPGRIGSLESDPATATATATGTGSGDSRASSCRLELWVPGTLAPIVTSTGVTSVRTLHTAGGSYVTGCARGAWRITVAGRS
jgi:endoglycosylceramidase